MADAWRRLRRNRLAMAGLVYIVILVLVAIFAPALAPADPYKQELLSRLAPMGAPSQITRTGTFILGADHLGRDILSRIIYGSRISLAVGLISEFIVTVIGVTVGLVAGYYGGWFDSLVMRVCDILFAFPDLLFCIGIMFALGPGLLNIFIALSVVGWAGMARLVRGQVLALKEAEYVEAARAQAVSDLRIMFRHILPGCLAPVIVSITLGIPGAIMGEASLSFLGLGAQPPTASWGSMIYDARAYLRTHPLFSVWPGIAIMLTVFAFNLFGDGLRDALDPRMKT
jgi:peptide/nickel transport system permease protein/oligopeptide transport system permease protein